MIKGYEEIVAFNKGNVEAVIKSSTIAVKGFEELSKALTALQGVQVEKLNAAVKALSGVKTPAELPQVYAQLAKENFDSFLVDGRKLAEVTASVLSASAEPLQARVQAFQGLVKTAA